MNVRDDEETIGLFEPLLVSDSSRYRSALNDLALELARRSEGFRRSLPTSIAAALADLVRSMNCCYSNLIEGHDTHPVDIERALAGDYSADLGKRNLQLEAKAHIVVQKWIDDGGLTVWGTSSSSSIEGVILSDVGSSGVGVETYEYHFYQAFQQMMKSARPMKSS